MQVSLIVALLISIGKLFAGIALLVFLAHLLIRIVRYFNKFPIPSFFVRLIDNPLRRRIQKPEMLAELLGAREGMRILEVGPGSGTYTFAVSELIGSNGRIIAVDIERTVLNGLRKRLRMFKVENVHPMVADVHNLPFQHQIFDAAYLITVIGEIPDADRAVQAIHDILKHGGRLMFSELLFDPDYPLARTICAWAFDAGFQPLHREGNLISYTLTFQRP